jgi:hypothetical protein
MLRGLAFFGSSSRVLLLLSRAASLALSLRSPSTLFLLSSVAKKESENAGRQRARKEKKRETVAF